MQRIVVISNRVTAPDTKSTAGGMAIALQQVLERQRGIWFGWSGEISASSELRRISNGQVDYITTDLSPDEYEGYYCGFSNDALWPTFHSAIDKLDYRDAFYQRYCQVNKRMAVAMAPHLKKNDLVWVHDYHLLPFGYELRRQGIELSTGYFHHIPFPHYDTFRTLPRHQELLQQMLAYDVIGFQTEADLQGFHDCVRQALDVTVMPRGAVIAKGKTIRIGVFPIGIDVGCVEQQANTAALSPRAQQLADSLGDRKLVIGVDRVDYSKGLVQRAHAYEQLLDRFPEQRRKIVYLQIAAPSRQDNTDYINLQRQLEEIYGNINGSYGDFDWVPIRYLNQYFSHAELMVVFRHARVGLVTPLRDGMNLVAKEYVAAQNADNPGVLVLSEFAGASKELESALIVNPHDTDATAEAIDLAVNMDLAERRERHQAMMQVLNRKDISAWLHHFLWMLSAVSQKAA